MIIKSLTLKYYLYKILNIDTQIQMTVVCLEQVGRIKVSSKALMSCVLWVFQKPTENLFLSCGDSFFFDKFVYFV